MNSRDRVYALLNLEEADRIAYLDFFWKETIDRWKREGLPDAGRLYGIRSHKKKKVVESVKQAIRDC